MAGKIYLEKGNIVVAFEYDPHLVELIRSIPGRRWINEEKIWTVPTEQARYVINTFDDHGFTISEDVLKLKSDGHLLTKKEYLTVSQLNYKIRSILTRGFPESFWIVGELSGFDRNKHKNHIFFKLVEKKEGADRPESQVTAVIWKSAKDDIFYKVKNASMPFDLKDGIQCMFKVGVDLYVQSGEINLAVEDIDPVYTIGLMAKRREEILNELKKKGIIHKNKEIEFPLVPLNIGLITSYQSDAYHDFIDGLKKSGYGFRVLLFDSHMQGEKMEKDILDGLTLFGDRSDIDLIVIARGGGSRVDLSWIDTMQIAFKAANCRKKIISAIGHYKDRCILDEITNFAKTPTAAADLLSGKVSEFLEYNSHNIEKILDRATGLIEKESIRLSETGIGIKRVVDMSIEREKEKLSGKLVSLEILNRNLLKSDRERLKTKRDKLAQGANHLIKSRSIALSEKRTNLGIVSRNTLKSTEEKLKLKLSKLTLSTFHFIRLKSAPLDGVINRVTIEKLKSPIAGERASVIEVEKSLIKISNRFLESEGEWLNSVEKQINNLDPVNVLKRGYSLIKDREDRIVRSIKDVTVGEEYSTNFYDGYFISKVKKKGDNK